MVAKINGLEMKVSESTNIAMPIKNLISIIAAVAIGVWAYFGITEKLNNHATQLELMSKDLEKAVEFSIKWPRGEMGSLPADAEQFLLIEDAIKDIEDIQIARYRKGEYYNWHVDGNGIRSAPNSPGHVRKISMSILLNDDYTGGELEIKEDGGGSEMPNTTGTIIVFPSYSLHRVKPVKKGTRYSLVAWLGGPKFR